MELINLIEEPNSYISIVHLMGYSFIFSALFAAGITYAMLWLNRYFDSPAIGIIFSIPCLAGILILSIRVSMLSGMS